jgi:hypothetical protein
MKPIVRRDAIQQILDYSGLFIIAAFYRQFSFSFLVLPVLEQMKEFILSQSLCNEVLLWRQY